MTIHVKEKPIAEPKAPGDLLELVAYKVHVINDKESNVQLGDIVLRLPAPNHGTPLIFNITQGKAAFIRGNSYAPFKCFRAHHIQSISLSFDDDTRPE